MRRAAAALACLAAAPGPAAALARLAACAPAALARLATLRAAAALTLLAAAPAAALDLALPVGAVLVHEESDALARHGVATAPFADGTLPVLPIDGAVTRQVWRVPAPTPTGLALVAPLRGQLEAQGARILLDCEAEACGGFDFRLGLEVLPAPAMFVDLGHFHYLSAEADGEWVSLLASRSAGMGFVQVIRVTGAPAAVGVPSDRPGDPPGDARSAAPSAADPAALPPLAAPAPPGDLAARLAAEGRAVLDGLPFATGSANLADPLPPEGEGALAALAAWMAANPAARVVLVGHTDATGALDANVALSRARARAVADRLARAHGVDPARLDADGMGYLSPRATNATALGREANRRVEAVALPP